MTQILPDGEYDLDLTGLYDSDETFLAICYGVSESLDTVKPMYLYDDSKNLILETVSTSQQPVIFEGVNQVHSKPPNIGSYFLQADNGVVKLKRLNNTIRFNKSRQSGKWSRLLNSRHKSEEKDKEIISEADFDDLALEMNFVDNDLDFTTDFEKDFSAFNSNKPEFKPKNMDIPTRDTSEPEPRLTKLRSNPLIRDTAPTSSTGKSITTPKTTKATASKTFHTNPQNSHNIKASKSLSTPQVLENSISNDDDFSDLEHQLDEILEYSSEEEYTGAPITILDDAKNSGVSYTNNSDRKPISLREFMGDNDSSSEGE